MRRAVRRGGPIAPAGVSLLEVLIAISLLGISFGAIFPGLSEGLRTTARLADYQQEIGFATGKLDEFVLDPTVVAGEERSGDSPSGIHWKMTAELVESRPLHDPDRPAQLLRINLEVMGAGKTGAPRFALQTLKLKIPEAPAKP